MNMVYIIYCMSEGDENGDIVLSQAISRCDCNSRSGISYKINSFEKDSKYFLVLRDVKIEDETESGEDYKNLLGSTWEILENDIEIGRKAMIVAYDYNCFFAVDIEGGTCWESSKLTSLNEMINWLKGKGAKRIK